MNELKMLKKQLAALNGLDKYKKKELAAKANIAEQTLKKYIGKPSAHRRGL